MSVFGPKVAEIWISSLFKVSLQKLRRILETPGKSWRLQMIQGTFRILQAPLGDSRCLKETPDALRRCLDYPGDAWTFQDSPEFLRSLLGHTH